MDDKISIIVILIMIITGVIMLIISYVPLFKNKYKLSKDITIESELKVLSENTSPQKKATSFVNLMKLSYVLVHTIINSGNKYNDQKQMKSFSNMMQDEKIIDKLNNLEGNNGYDLF